MDELFIALTLRNSSLLNWRFPKLIRSYLVVIVLILPCKLLPYVSNLIPGPTLTPSDIEGLLLKITSSFFLPWLGWSWATFFLLLFYPSRVVGFGSLMAYFVNLPGELWLVLIVLVIRLFFCSWRICRVPPL